MEEKTTEEIIQDNSELAEKILNQEPNVETYTGEFKETYNKKWVALDEVNSKLSQIKKELKGKLWKEVEIYIQSIKKKIPFGLLLSHGYSLDDRKEWKKLRSKFKPNNKQRKVR